MPRPLRLPFRRSGLGGRRPQTPPLSAANLPSCHRHPPATSSCVRATRRALQTANRFARIGFGGSTRATLGMTTTRGSVGHPPGPPSLFRLPLPRFGSATRATLDSPSGAGVLAFGSALDCGSRFTPGPGLPVITGFRSFAIGCTLGLWALCFTYIGSCGLCGPPGRCGTRIYRVRHFRGLGYAC